MTTDELIAMIRHYPEFLPVERAYHNGWVRCPVCHKEGCTRTDSTFYPPTHEDGCPRAKLQALAR